MFVGADAEALARPANLQAVEGWHQAGFERRVGAVEFEAPLLDPVVGLPAGHVDHGEVLAVVERDDSCILVEQASNLELLLTAEAGEDVWFENVRNDLLASGELADSSAYTSGTPRSPMISRTMWMPSVKTIPPRSCGMLCQISAEHPTGVAAWNGREL